MALRQRKERSDDAAVRFQASLQQKIRHLQRMMADVDGRRQKLASACAAEEQQLKRRCATEIRKYQRESNDEVVRRVGEAAEREGWDVLQ